MELCEATTITELLEEGRLSVRSYNVCYKKKLKLFGEICKYYISHRNFLAFENVGARTNHELSELCRQYLLQSEQQSTSKQLELAKNESPEHPIVLKYVSLTEEQKALAESLYKKLRFQLSTRAFNSLSLFCQEDSLVALINKLEAAGFNFYALKNVGEKTVNELSSFFTNLANYLNDNNLNSVSTQVRTRALILQIEEIVGKMSFDCHSFIVENFAKLETGDFPLMFFMERILKESEIVKERYKELLLELSGFFRIKSEPNKDEISARVGLTKERIRQLFQRDQFHIKAVEKLGLVIEILSEFGFQMPTELILPKGKFFIINLEYLNKQTHFTNLFLLHLVSVLNPNFLLVSFEVDDEERTILINKGLLRKIDIAALCQKIVEITSSRVDEDFEVNITGFISLYFKEDLSWKERDNLILVVEELIGSLYGLYADENKILTIKRNTKRKVWESIYDILKEYGQPMHIADISAEMNKKGFEFEPENVRSHTLKQDSIFVVAGNSIYGLKEWEDEGKIVGGTIRHVIEKYLASFNEPKHLYEIAKHVMNYRNTNINSVHRNIIADPHKRIKCFGEYFFGLPEKKYDFSKFKICPMNRHWYKEAVKLLREENTFLQKKKVVEHIVNLYGVRPAQVEYLIYERVRKGDLIEQNELLILNESN